MRRYFNNGGSGFLETVTKLTPGGAIANTIKKIKKSKEDKDSRNPDPKTPKMDSDKETKKETKRQKKIDRSQLYKDNTFSNAKINKFFEDKKNKQLTKTAKNLSELKSGKIKTLPISSEQQNNKGKKKLQSAFNKG